MRDLVAAEKGDAGPLDLKLAPGGLLDLDFLAQALVLGHAQAHPDLVGRDARGVLERAGTLGLLPGDAADRLVAAYRLLDDIHQWQRLMIEGDPADPPPAVLGRIAVAAGLPDARALTAQLEEERRMVRALFERLLG